MFPNNLGNLLRDCYFIVNAPCTRETDTITLRDPLDSDPAGVNDNQRKCIHLSKL